MLNALKHLLQKFEINKFKNLFQPSQMKPQTDKYKKKKHALLLAYSGVDYYGMQINHNVPTIEKELFSALYKANLISYEECNCPILMKFQRAARTDKGVSALGQVCSLKMSEIANSTQLLNENLPPHIRAIDIFRVTQGFNSKLSCSHRTYIYLMPTYGFVPFSQLEKLEQNTYRISEETLKRVREAFNIYEGAHNFHNFTTGREHCDNSCIRYIMKTDVSSPSVKSQIEWVTITIQGQSFMLHQIRKMIGLVMAYIRGLVDLNYIHNAWLPHSSLIPKCPGLGLILKQVHYTHYNRKFEKDPTKQSIDFDQYEDVIEQFGEQHVYSNIWETESRDKTIFEWSLETMPEKFALYGDRNVINTEALGEKIHGPYNFITKKEKTEKSVQDVQCNKSQTKSKETFKEILETPLQTLKKRLKILA